MLDPFQSITELQPETVIFDYDGTIADLPIDWISLRPQFLHLAKEISPRSNFSPNMRVDEMEFELLNQNPNHLPRILAWRRSIEEAVRKPHVPFAKVLLFIRELKEEGNPHLFIISNNLTQTVQMGLRQLDLSSAFQDVYGFDRIGMPKPSTKGADVLSREHSPNWNKTVFLGDSDRTDKGFCQKVGIPYFDVNSAS